MPKWIKSGARSQTVLQLACLEEMYFLGFKYGKLYWKSRPMMCVRYNTALTYNYVDSSYTPQLNSNIDNFIQEKNTDIENVVESLIKEIAEHLDTNPVSTRKETGELFKKFLRSMTVMMAARAFTERISQYVKNIIGEERWSAHGMSLVQPHKKTMLLQEHEDILRLSNALKQKDKDLIDSYAKELEKKYGFIHSEYVSRNWTAKDYIECAGIRTGNSETSRVNPSQFEAKDAYLAWLITILQKLVYVYDEEKSVAVRVNWALRKSLLALGADENLILNCTKEEFQHWINTEKLPQHDALADRSLYFAGIPNERDMEFLFEKEPVWNIVEKYSLEEFLPLSDKQTKVLKGSCAFQGKVRGRVHIVHTQKDVANFVKGEVLVSSMTTPAFFGAMQKAAAFVTDEGGVLSHAAIVSRELKIPCIVGTNNATRILRDGMMVEVDANKGIVKILKRTNK